MFQDFKYIAPQYKKKPVEVNSSMDGDEVDGGTNPRGAAMRSGKLRAEGRTRTARTCKHHATLRLCHDWLYHAQQHRCDD